MAFEEVIIGNARLIHGDCREVLAELKAGDIDAVVTDPPYSERCHSVYNSGGRDRRDGTHRQAMGYKALTIEDVQLLAREYDRVCVGWVVWMTDSDLALHVRHALESLGRTTFPPLPFYQPGRSARLSGDGPSSWTDWIVVARTKAQVRWGTLPGGYVAGPGWRDKAIIGGKPTLLMDALVSDYSRPGHTVLDTHMGAGTTGVAAARMGRGFIGIEIDPQHFEIACRRIEKAYEQPRLFDDAEVGRPTAHNARMSGLFALSDS